MKECRYCGRLCPEENFGVALTTPNKVFRRRKCKDCYRETKNALIKRHYAWINEFKAGKGCVRCGIRNPIVLDFHHVNGDKEFGISGRRREVGFAKLHQEIDKCVIICSNCHRIEHFELEQRKRSGASYTGSTHPLGGC